MKFTQENVEYIFKSFDEIVKEELLNDEFNWDYLHRKIEDVSANFFNFLDVFPKDYNLKTESNINMCIQYLEPILAHQGVGGFQGDFLLSSYIATLCSTGLKQKMDERMGNRQMLDSCFWMLKEVAKYFE